MVVMPLEPGDPRFQHVSNLEDTLSTLSDKPSFRRSKSFPPQFPRSPNTKNVVVCNP